MKPLLITALCCGWLTNYAQSTYQSDDINAYQLRLSNLAIQESYKIALHDYFPKKSRYSVWVKVRLPNDSTFYTLPQTLPSGDSFGVQLQVDIQSHRDTLEIFRRMGEGRLSFAEVKILAFASQRKHSRIRYERGFAEFVLHRLSLRPSSVSSF